ncbi:MAG: hypothetical protein EON51_09155 [Acinetobacter sp.]|nr:MAG: hypothetical protein EON51_09155 [Acinetobacter sp.]
MILTGQNDISRTQDYSIDLRLKLYDKYRGGNEFGYTGMEDRITSTHRCYVLNNDVKCYASHLVHEYMHQIGFRDVKSWRGGKWTKINSVPYKVGRLVDKFIANNNLTLIKDPSRARYNIITPGTGTTAIKNCFY